MESESNLKDYPFPLIPVAEYSGIQYDLGIIFYFENGRFGPYKHLVFRVIKEFHRAIYYWWVHGKNQIVDLKA